RHDAPLDRPRTECLPPERGVYFSSLRRLFGQNREGWPVVVPGRIAADGVEIVPVRLKEPSQVRRPHPLWKGPARTRHVEQMIDGLRTLHAFEALALDA